MEGGDLRKALWKNENDEYAWERRGAQVALDIARGLHFLHSSGVIHRCAFTCCGAWHLHLCHVPCIWPPLCSLSNHWPNTIAHHHPLHATSVPVSPT